MNFRSRNYGKINNSNSNLIYSPQKSVVIRRDRYKKPSFAMGLIAWRQALQFFKTSRIMTTEKSVHGFLRSEKV